MAGGKKEALSTVFSCASKYQEELVGRSLLFVFMDGSRSARCLETAFSASGFKHMTGFRTDLPAKQFFKLCLDRRLSEDDFEFRSDGTTRLKLKVLPQLVKKDLSANMVGDYNGSHLNLRTDKLAGGVNACVGLVRAREGGPFVPNTVLMGDIRDKVNNPYRIVLTYRKAHGEVAYSELVRQAKGVDFGKLELPSEYSYLPIPL